MICHPSESWGKWSEAGRVNSGEQRKANRLVIDNIQKYSSDPSRKHEILNFFYLKSESDAGLLVQLLKDHGFGPVLVEDQTKEFPETGWAVKAFYNVKPTDEVIDAMTDFCSQSADSVGGEYDGWEAKMERD